MEGAIKLIQFCMDQEEQGRPFSIEFNGPRYNICGWESEPATNEGYIVRPHEFLETIERLTPERADEIIKIINDRIAKL